MRTLRLTLAGTVILVLLGGLGAVTLAQEDAQGSTGFTMKVVEYSEDENWIFEQVEASDPRLSGAWTMVDNCEQNASPWLGVCVGRVRVENEGGTWLGQYYHSFAVTPSYLDAWTMLEGQGDYAGLTAFMNYDEERMGDDPDRDGEGVIFDFGMPPMPDPIEPSTE